MSRDVGGTELPSILRALAASLRQDAAVRSEVEARQSWVLNAARLGVAAPWVVLLLLASRGEAAAAYNSPPGLILLSAGFGITVVAYRLMIALGRLPEERRWFA
jgi:tight adherence protein B